MKKKILTTESTEGAETITARLIRSVSSVVNFFFGRNLETQ